MKKSQCIISNGNVTVRCPGTFGEFVQGKFDDLSFLITSPINRYSSTAYTSVPIGSLQVDAKLSKVRRICTELASLLEVDFQGFIEVKSDIPHGKGMASSSADIIGAGSALLHAAGVPAMQHAALLECAAKRVEPTDGVMHAGVVCFGQHDCQLIENLGPITYEILGVILPGEIDTCEYNSASIKYSDANKRNFVQAFELARTGIENRNLALLGRASTISAEINQHYLPKPHFDRVLRVVDRNTASGVVVAHSGVVIGVLLSSDVTLMQRQAIRQDLEDIYGFEVESFISEMVGPIARRYCIPRVDHTTRHAGKHFYQTGQSSYIHSAFL